MRMVIQRVSKVQLTANGLPFDEMGEGLLVMVGLQEGDDDKAVMKYMLEKLIYLRCFEDANGKMNLSVLDTGRSLFLVSNFTLYGDLRHGRRPSYSSAASAEKAGAVFEELVAMARELYPDHIHQGMFQADMEIQAELNGPVTLLLDSDKVI